MKTFSNKQLGEFQRRFGLSYQVTYLAKGEQEIGLSGYNVLEVGGSLPKELVLDEIGANKWISIEDSVYWQEVPEYAGGARPSDMPDSKVSDMTSDLPDYHVFEGQIEDIPRDLNNSFDRIVSFACFEHIHTLGHALRKMYNVLKPKGQLFSVFSPIWSAYDGHHLPKFKDAGGKVFSHKDIPIPPWGNLLLNPPEMEYYLLGRTDEETAAKLIYHIYHSPHINRLFTEDYALYLKNSKFTINKLKQLWSVSVPEDTLKLLCHKYPGRKLFANNGIIMVLQKD